MKAISWYINKTAGWIILYSKYDVHEKNINFFLRARLKNIKFGFYSIKHSELSKMGHDLKKTLVSIRFKYSADADVRGALNNLTGNHSSVDG